MRQRRLIVVALLLAACVPGANPREFEIDGISYQRLVYERETLGQRLDIYCVDHVIAARAKVPELTESALAEAAAKYDTDSVLLCIAHAVRGDPYFSPTSFSYVVDRTNYNVTYRGTEELVGSAGRMREGSLVIVLVALPGLERGTPFRLYYDRDHLLMTLEPL